MKRNKPGSERGQSLIELAIALSVILMLLAGAVDFGMGLFAYVALRDAAQEGALYASLYPCIDNCTLANTTAIQQRVQSASTHPLDLASFDPSTQIIVEYSTPGVWCEGITGGMVNAVTVTVKYNHPIVMPFAGTILGQQWIPLQASVTDTILQPTCDTP